MIFLLACKIGLLWLIFVMVRINWSNQSINLGGGERDSRTFLKDLVQSCLLLISWHLASSSHFMDPKSSFFSGFPCSTSPFVMALISSFPPHDQIRLRSPRKNSAMLLEALILSSSEFHRLMLLWICFFPAVAESKFSIISFRWEHVLSNCNPLIIQVSN